MQCEVYLLTWLVWKSNWHTLNLILCIHQWHNWKSGHRNSQGISNKCRFEQVEEPSNCYINMEKNTSLSFEVLKITAKQLGGS